MDDIKAKQQIVEKIKASTNILVTVSNDPSVDALSAALGLTLLLDKLDKHPTAVFSGDVPPAISFLEPEKTFDSTTDSLRDFIIALDKEKADHLRYKVEGDSVKIFITPYKTTITSDDLEFSQGDFNVELVIALGVDVQEHLDSALDAHGQILHDAAIITVTAGEQVSNLGGIDWHDDQASSLSEMITGLAEALKPDKKSLIDGPIASAFLTGIVAETDRFSNSHTTSRVMTIAANLMANGADQQLIASKLQESHAIGTGDVAKDESFEVVEQAPKPERKDTLLISHKPDETLEEMDKRVKAAEQVEAFEEANEQLGEHTSNTNAAGVYAFETNDGKKDEEPVIEQVTEAVIGLVAEEPLVQPSIASDQVDEPLFGGTLNATTEQAADDARRELENDQNKTILSHSYLASSSVVDTPTSSTAGSSYVLGHDDMAATPDLTPSHELVIEPPVVPIASTPADLGLPMPPALPDFSAPPVMAPAYAFDPGANASQSDRLGDILAPEPPLPSPTPPPVFPPTAPSNDPGQFKIPGQQ